MQKVTRYILRGRGCVTYGLVLFGLNYLVAELEGGVWSLHVKGFN